MTTMPQPASLTSSYTATYDAWNRLTQISAGSTTVAKYQYDGSNRRIVKLTYTGGTLSETRHFYFTSNWQDIEERVGSSTSMDKQFVWGMRYIDELVCRDDATPLRLYATQDANYNLTGLTNTSGTVQQRFQYDPYGNSTVLTSGWTSTTDVYAWTPRFQRGQYDLATAMYLFRNRDLHPLLGMWLQRDPVHGINLYEFAMSRPGSNVDPYGLQTAESYGPGTGPAGAAILEALILAAEALWWLPWVLAALAAILLAWTAWGCRLLRIWSNCTAERCVPKAVAKDMGQPSASNCR